MSDVPAPNGPAPNGPAPKTRGRLRRRLLVDLAVLIALIADYAVIPVRAGHVVLGYGACAVVLAHMAQHGPAARRSLRAGGAARRRALADAALFVLLALTTVTGIWQLSDAAAARPWHSTAGTATLLLALGHGWRRRHAMINATRSLIRRGRAPAPPRAGSGRHSRPAAR